MEGCALTSKWSTRPCIVESDCLELVAMTKSGEDDRSSSIFMLRVLKSLLSELVEHIRREQNLVSDDLAKLGRSEARTVAWLPSGPSDIRRLYLEDCNTIS
jgi:hypothetical protein